ncbi:hypothetical protein LCGC14_0878530 [marine sediment metagenome]|uniref:Uncharacterized protein n=1 Tax=marine sediment metagenome TaxID=412755 RepID=A0A0F9PN85_9ZZZZ|nr:hypothetical protein [Phycisphaerae bacterium]
MILRWGNNLKRPGNVWVTDFGEFSFQTVARPGNVGVEGIEFAATGEPLHYEAPFMPVDFAADVNRLHFAADEGDT